ncbi:MAG: iron uptake porin, partial [Microcoleaceae cyanobacterium]
LQAGIGFQWNPSPWFDLDFFIGSESGSPQDPLRGIFNGGYGVSTRAVFRFDPVNVILYYNHSYSPENGVNTASGSNASAVRGAGPVAGNTYVGAVSYQFSPKFIVIGSGGFINARTLGDGTRGDANVIDYRVNVIFPDLFQEGNIAGIVAGIQPRLTYTSNRELARAIGLPPGQRSDRDTGWHLEAFYTFRVSDNITITPGVFLLTAPNHDERNPDVVVGAIRTTFNF